MRPAAIEVGLLFDVVWASLAAGVAVTVLFSLVVRFGARSAEARRGGEAAAALVYAGLALIAMTAFALVVAYGVSIMLSKD